VKRVDCIGLVYFKFGQQLDRVLNSGSLKVD
jgi:hypothetical protein